MNPETKALLLKFAEKISESPDLAFVEAKCNEFLGKLDPREQLAAASVFSLTNPFFLPAVDDEVVSRLAFNLDQFSELLMRAKLSAARARQPNILVACAPKSASTFISGTLRRTMSLGGANLMAASLYMQTPYAMGIVLREQETDELALIRHGLNQRGYVAQHHVRATPYLCRQLKTFNIMPIVTYRNLFDSIVSLDDMFRKARQKGSTGNADVDYFLDALPDRYHEMDDETRLTALVHLQAHWFLQFYLSWKKCERMGFVKPLWVSYEKDFLNDKPGLAERIAAYVGPDYLDASKLAEAFADTETARGERLNKGVAGRGAQMPESVRRLILEIAEPYRAEEDLSELVGD
ncbi:hypothetical protein ACU5AY_11655 [Rhizobium sp. PAMB 3174]